MKAAYHINRPGNRIPSMEITAIPGKSDPLEFHSMMPGYRPTPLVSLPALAAKYGVGSLVVKDESFRLGLDSFKVLGASYAISRMLERNPGIETFCAATEGNHGRAVAWAARYFGRQAVIFVPYGTSRNRILAIGKEGARVEIVDGNYDEACEAARGICCSEGWELVQDTAWNGYLEVPSLIMAGYTTLFREMENDVSGLPLPEVDIVFLQAGVGSFAASGIRYWLERYGDARPAIVVVEPCEADAILESFRQGEPAASKGGGRTIMSGLNCPTPSIGAWDIIRSGCDISLAIPDSYSRRAMRELCFPSGNDQQVISGESGAAGLAGFMAIMMEQQLEPAREFLKVSPQSRILCVSTEGATDRDIFDRVVSDGPVAY